MTYLNDSPLGKRVFDRPYFVIVEGKKDDFNQGWGQCLAEMLAAQKMNEDSDQEVFGITSNGEVWKFGKLRRNRFTENKTFYTIQDLDQLFAAINYVFQQCERIVDRQVIPQNNQLDGVYEGSGLSNP